MSTIIVAGIVLGLLMYVFIGTTVLRVSARMVAGVTPTFGSALGTIVVSAIVSTLVWRLSSFVPVRAVGARVLIALISLGVQAMIFTVMIHDSKGRDVSYGQSLLIILFQIPVAIVLIVVLAMLFAAGGITLLSLTQHDPLYRGWIADAESKGQKKGRCSCSAPR